MNSSSRLLLPSLFVTAFLAMAPATLAQKNYAVGISGGAAIPTGRFSDAHSTGYTINAFVALGLADLPIGIRFDGIYNKFSGRTVTPPGGGADVENPDLRLMGILGNLIYTFSGTTAKPYVITGAGFYSSKPDSSGAASRNDFGFNAGLGATFGLGPLIAVLEARYHSISRDDTAGGTIHYVPIKLGVMF